MARNAFIFHGTGGNPDVAWYPWLAGRLAARLAHGERHSLRDRRPACATGTRSQEPLGSGDLHESSERPDRIYDQALRRKLLNSASRPHLLYLF